jgi:hypothetical protein
MLAFCGLLTYCFLGTYGVRKFSDVGAWRAIMHLQAGEEAIPMEAVLSGTHTGT